jgi:hypothetical protein
MCHRCEVTFSKKSNWKRHYKEKHTDEVKKYGCPFCTYTSTRKDDMVKHVKCKHEDKYEEVKSNVSMIRIIVDESEVKKRKIEDNYVISDTLSESSLSPDLKRVMADIINNADSEPYIPMRVDQKDNSTTMSPIKKGEICTQTAQIEMVDEGTQLSAKVEGRCIDINYETVERCKHNVPLPIAKKKVIRRKEEITTETEIRCMRCYKMTEHQEKRREDTDSESDWDF